MRFSVESMATALRAAGLLAESRGHLPHEAAGITDDSRAVRPGYVFVAVRGTERDGHEYLGAAAEAGATAVIVEDAARATLPALVVNDGRRAAAIAAAAAYGFPTQQLRLVGVTGTNGKTTTVSILRHLLDGGLGGQRARGRSCSIGTLGVLIGTEGRPMPGGGGLTTPGPIELQRIFRALVDDDVTSVAMEVSSHALDQRRVEGVLFDITVFTNLTRDHLDYHGTMEAYFRAKASLVDHLLPHGTVVTNLDDKAWTALPSGRRRVSFSERVLTAEVHSEHVRFAPRGSSWVLALGDERHDVELPLIGDFNVLNALGAAAAAWALGLPGHVIAARLSTVPQVPGRLEILSESPTVLRDYAHTPDALARTITAVRPFTQGRLIVVFGCGGDRDRGKRPEMGRIAEEGADVAIVTSDNPRKEDPASIIDEIVAGMRRENHECVVDRRAAIQRALNMASPADVILLAGKGHETYQIRGTTKYPFDEKLIVNELLQVYR